MRKFDDYNNKALETGVALGPVGVDQLREERGSDKVIVDQINPVTALRAA